MKTPAWIKEAVVELFNHGIVYANSDMIRADGIICGHFEKHASAELADLEECRELLRDILMIPAGLLELNRDPKSWMKSVREQVAQLNTERKGT